MSSGKVEVREEQMLYYNDVIKYGRVGLVIEYFTYPGVRLGIITLKIQK